MFLYDTKLWTNYISYRGRRGKSETQSNFSRDNSIYGGRKLKLPGENPVPTLSIGMGVV